MTRLGTSETITTAAQYSNIHSEKASVITNTATSGNKSANGTINKLIELTYEYCVQYVVCLDSLSSSLSLRRCLSIHSDKLESCRLWVFVLCNQRYGRNGFDSTRQFRFQNIQIGNKSSIRHSMKMSSLSMDVSIPLITGLGNDQRTCSL